MLVWSVVLLCCWSSWAVVWFFGLCVVFLGLLSPVVVCFWWCLYGGLCVLFVWVGFVLVRVVGGGSLPLLCGLWGVAVCVAFACGGLGFCFFFSFMLWVCFISVVVWIVFRVGPPCLVK